MMDFQLMVDSLPKYLTGLWLTVKLLSISLLIGFFLSVLVALARNANNKWLSRPAWGFIYYFRGTPLLVQLYLIYYGLGQLDFIKTTFLWVFFQEAYYCALLALVLNNTAYTAELFYGAIVTTDKGEVEAGRAYGMSQSLLLRRIILPSALRRALPPYGNEIIFMLHATSLVSLITLVDLTGVARMIYARYYAPFEAFLVVMLFYLALTFILVFLVRRVELYFNRHRSSLALD